MTTTTTKNHLKLNDNKTEALLIKSNKTNFPDDTTSLNILFTTLVSRFHIIWLDINHKHTWIVCHSAYVEIRHSALFAKTFEATKTLVCAFVLSKLDYCNSLLLSGCPLYLLSNCAVKLGFSQHKNVDYVQSLLQALHWSIQARIDYKLSTICYKFFSDSFPAYFSDLLRPSHCVQMCLQSLKVIWMSRAQRVLPSCKVLHLSL